MRFNCGPSLAQKRWDKKLKMKDWHKHFCWWPVRIANGDCRWLETIERRYDVWDYQWGPGSKVKYRECT